MKQIEVNISQCLSSTQEIEVPDDFEYDQDELKRIVEKNIMLPSDCAIDLGYDCWHVDDLCVIYE